MALHFSKRGHGPPLVMIHGLFGSLENLGTVVRNLSDAFTVYSPDLPNHGRSAHIDQAGLPEMAEILRRWMQQQGLHKAHFLGHSLGGKVAMELALTHSDLVDQLVVLDIAPVKYQALHSDVFTGLLAVDLANISSRSQAEEMLKVHVDEFAVRSFLLKNLVKTPAGHFAWRMNLHGLHRDYPKLVDSNREGQPFTGATLFIKGGGSHYISEKYRDETLKRFPNTQLKIVPGAGHWLHAEKPELVSALVRKFLVKE